MDKIEKEILNLISDKGSLYVYEIINHLKNYEEKKVIEVVEKLEEEKKIILYEKIPSNTKFIDYIKDITNSLWFFLTLAITFLTVLFVTIIPNVYPFYIFRWIVATLYIIFLPGYISIEAFFPRRYELDLIERIALSLALSLAVVPLIGLLLNYTIKITLENIVISLTVFILIVSFIALYRKYYTAKHE